jgi:type IV pilus assembly protein PilV
MKTASIKIKIPHTPMELPSRQTGFSLIETLVAIVLLSLGVLGTIGLQAAALQSNQDARQQSIALSLASELADHIRSNHGQSVSTAATNPYLGDFASGHLTPTNSSTCLGIGTTCTSNLELAQSQMTDWLARVNATLPGARVAICRNTAPYSSTGIPQWPGSCTTEGSEVIYIQIGWDRRSTNTANRGTDDNAAWIQATTPSIVLAVLPGVQ